MQEIKLSNAKDGLSITKLAVGHNGLTDEKRCGFTEWYLDAYLDAGGNCIDTARMYDGGLAERAVGGYIRSKQRDRIVLVTKCAHYDGKIKNPPHRLAPEDIRGDVNTSLSELGTDYIDILFLHRDDIKRGVEEIMPVLHEFVKAGKVRLLGASNWTGRRIMQANRFAGENGLTPFSVSQIHHSLALTTPAASGDLSHVIMDGAEYSWYKDKKFPVMAWSSSAHGFFSKLSAGESTDSLTNRYGWLPENRRRAERVQNLSWELGVSVGALALAYLMCDENVPTCAVTAFSNEKQYGEAVEAANVSLTGGQIEYLRG
ncbi:MAG: aldo/keto reductase [Oscillospiraceae bacterium]|nr:aldo/keto reductase [Oscillospiraceae bacterium]